MSKHDDIMALVDGCLHPDRRAALSAAVAELVRNAERFSHALVNVMDGTKDYEIQAETGLSELECEAIAKARAAAREWKP